MPFELPTIVRDAERLVVEIELRVRQFPRFHKYGLGSELREQARSVLRYAHRAWRDQARRAEWADRLAFAIDDLKMSLQLAKQVQAFKSFRQFEVLGRMAADLGRQCGGWKKQIHSNGQNARAGKCHAQRPETLSSQSASYEARL